MGMVSLVKKHNISVLSGHHYNLILQYKIHFMWLWANCQTEKFIKYSTMGTCPRSICPTTNLHCLNHNIVTSEKVTIHTFLSDKHRVCEIILCPGPPFGEPQRASQQLMKLVADFTSVTLT